MKTAVSTLAVIATLAAVPQARAADLRTDDNAGLTQLLTGLDVLDAQKFEGGLEVRLYRAGELGQCMAGKEALTCPHGQLLIVATVVQGGAAAAMLWRSSRQIGWQFVRRIDSVGTGRSPGSRSFGEVHLEVKDCEASPQVESGEIDAKTGGGWREVHYTLSVGLETATFTRMPGDTPPCEMK